PYTTLFRSTAIGFRRKASRRRFHFSNKRSRKIRASHSLTPGWPTVTWRRQTRSSRREKRFQKQKRLRKKRLNSMTRWPRPTRHWDWFTTTTIGIGLRQRKSSSARWFSIRSQRGATHFTRNFSEGWAASM